MNTEFRVCMKTKDGQLIQNRKSDPRFWFHLNMELDKDFAEVSLKKDCAEKGVCLVSYTASVDGVNAIVEWL